MAALAARGGCRGGLRSHAASLQPPYLSNGRRCANTVRILGRVDPKFSRLKAEEIIDERIVRKLEREGALPR